MLKAKILSEIKVSPQKNPSKMEKFLKDIVERIEQAVYEKCLTEDRIFISVEYRDGWIEVHMKSNGTSEVVVCHSDNEHESPTLEAAITGILPDWCTVWTRAFEEERKEQEFRDYLWRCSRYW